MTEATSGTSARTGLQFTSIEEASVTSEIRIHDAEGVAVTVGDEIEMHVPAHPEGPAAQDSRQFGRVLEVRATEPSDTFRPPAVIVGWNHNQRVGEVAAEMFENYCRILVSVAGEKTPAAAVAGTEPRERARSLSTVETAKLIRKALRVAFPATKFSVRSESYSGGSSIDIRWTDGPTSAEVDEVSGGFAGGGFDGSIDLHYYVTSWLSPDGTASPAHSTGTEGSRGSVPGFDYPRPHPDAELVTFGAHYVFTQRETTLDEAAIGRDLCELQGLEFVDLNQREILGAGDRFDLRDHVRNLLARTSIPAGADYAGVRYDPDGATAREWCAIDFA